MYYRSYFYVMYIISIYFVTILFTSSVQVSAYEVFRPGWKRNRNLTLTPVGTKTKHLFRILDGLPDNELFRTKSCGIMEQEMPDFRAPDRRISEVKCLEQLWKRRFFDEVLLKKIRCRSGVEGAYVSFSVYNGIETSTGTFAYTGAVGWKAGGDAWIFLCGAALISDRFMLTAAHCSTSHDKRIADPSPKIVRLGAKNILDSHEYRKSPVDVDIKNFIVHENYLNNLKRFDIALIELEDSIPFKVFSNPSCIWSDDQAQLFGKAYEAGWGVVQSNEIGTPKFQIADLDVLEPKTCDDKIKQLNTTWTYSSTNQLCAEYSSNDTCKGDSGGPLLMPIRNPGYTDFIVHYIIGIESENFGCDSTSSLNVYTSVSAFLDWIENIVWGDESTLIEYLSEKQFAKIYEGL